MGIKIRTNLATFLLLFGLNLVVSFLAYFILPAKFFSDTKIIVYDIGHEIGYIGSYPLSILFYKVTFLNYLPFPIIALIQYPILIYLLYKIGIPKDFHILTVKNILVYLAFLMLAIFVSMPSKEFITFIYISIIPFVLNNPNKSARYRILSALLLIVLFGLFFRIYYVFIPIIALVMYWVTFIKFKNKTVTSLFYGVLISIFLSLSVGVLTGKYISESTREELNQDRKNAKDANSMIVSPIATDTWYGETIGVINGFIAVNIPVVEGLKHILSPQIIAFIVWQLFLFYILLKRFSWCIRDREKNQMQLWSILIIFSYFITQGLFEPDLGSAIRHKMGFFPLIYFALYYEHFRKELRSHI